MKNYIAYGSNMDTGQMARRCPNARLLGVGEVEGYTLLFKGVDDRNYATIEPATGHRVPVLLWAIDAQDEANLDRYEEYPRMYEKAILPVRLRDGNEVVEGLIYLMPQENPMHAPTRSYYRVIERAYRKFGFEESALRQALEKTGEPLREERERLYEFPSEPLV